MRLALLSKAAAPRPKGNRKRPSQRAVGDSRHGSHARRQGGVRERLRSVGAALWPERFPDVAARRAAATSSGRLAPRGFIWIWGFAISLAVVAFVLHLHVRFDIIQTGYALSQAQAEQRRLRLAQRELRLELATLKEPGRIEEQARELLSMDRPDHDRIIRLDERGRRSRRAARRR